MKAALSNIYTQNFGPNENKSFLKIYWWYANEARTKGYRQTKKKFSTTSFVWLSTSNLYAHFESWSIHLIILNVIVCNIWALKSGHDKIPQVHFHVLYTDNSIYSNFSFSKLYQGIIEIKLREDLTRSEENVFIPLIDFGIYDLRIWDVENVSENYKK